MRLLNTYFKKLAARMNSVLAEHRLKFPLNTQLILKPMKRDNLKGARHSGACKLLGAYVWQ